MPVNVPSNLAYVYKLLTSAPWADSVFRIYRPTMADLMEERHGIYTYTFIPLGLGQLKMAPRCAQTQ